MDLSFKRFAPALLLWGVVWFIVFRMEGANFDGTSFTQGLCHIFALLLSGAALFVAFCCDELVSWARVVGAVVLSLIVATLLLTGGMPYNPNDHIQTDGFGTDLQYTDIIRGGINCKASGTVFGDSNAFKPVLTQDGRCSVRLDTQRYSVNAFTYGPQVDMRFNSDGSSTMIYAANQRVVAYFYDHTRTAEVKEIPKSAWKGTDNGFPRTTDFKE